MFCFVADMSNILKEIEKGNTAAVKRILAINPNSVLVVDAAVRFSDNTLFCFVLVAAELVRIRSSIWCLA